MSRVDDVERAILDEYMVVAQCFPASDRGLDAFRRLWLDSVADELAPAIAGFRGRRMAPPPPFDKLIVSFVAEENAVPGSETGARPVRSADPVAGTGTCRHQVLQEFVRWIGSL
ncbi:hypothetical protein ACFVFS_14130 [Kitasatospora sp. NPDC057692]|uniref:hypothetical protein n=1 Tax=Kitasatospora sp. NPDC057692 TaxID=3346215 RepID=UPI003687B1A6